MFSNISRSVYKSKVRFSFKNLSKIENLYISQVRKNRNLAKYEKNKILLSRKKKEISHPNISPKERKCPQSVSSSNDIKMSAERTNPVPTLPPCVATS